MKNTLRAAVALALLASSAPAPAQEAQPRLGLGLSMNTTLIGSLFSGGVTAPATQLYVPVYVTRNIRLEPSIGWVYGTDDEQDVTDSTFALGIGALYVAPLRAQTQLYAGLRLASIWMEDQDRVFTSTETTTQQNTVVAAVLGAEYLPVPWFSVGVEGQIEYVAVGDIETESGGTTSSEDGGSLTSTQGLFFLRAYFF